MSSFLLLLLALAQVPLLQTAGGTLSGTVRTEDGKPAAGIRVAAMAAANLVTGTGDAAALFSITQTDELGRYTLENVPPGRVFVTAGRVDLPTYFPGATSAATAVPIEVTSAVTLKDLDFLVAQSSAEPPPRVVQGASLVRGGDMPMVRVPGHLVIPNFKAASQLRLIGRSPVAKYRNGIDIPGGVSVTTEVIPYSDGSFYALLPVGQVSIQAEVRLPKGFRVDSMTSGSTDLLAQPLDTSSATSTIPEIVITLAADPPSETPDGGPQR